MRTYYSLLFLMLLLTSCDDGDIIITSFDFEDRPISMCNSGREKVLFHRNNDGVFETLTITITNTNFSTEVQNLIVPQSFLRVPLTSVNYPPIAIDLGGNNEVIYRTYDGEIPQNYFCTNVPPANPRVLQEYRSVGGSILINTNIVYHRNRTGQLDHDGDGVPSSQEGMAEMQDTDGDGIPDYLDRDDDGDNVPTENEINTNLPGQDPTATGYPDTDGDGIPNFLDPDDDGDGVPTRREVSEAFLRPTQNSTDGIPWYLNPEIRNRYPNPVPNQVDNTIQIRYESFIQGRNLTLQKSGDGETIFFDLIDLGTFTTAPIITPIISQDGQVVDEDEEEDNGDEE